MTIARSGDLEAGNRLPGEELDKSVMGEIGRR